VRSHAHVSTAGSSQRQGGGLRLALLVAAAAAFLLVPVAAAQAFQKAPVKVTLEGTGTGTVTTDLGEPPLNCHGGNGTTCETTQELEGEENGEEFQFITYSASADLGSAFAGWTVTEAAFEEENCAGLSGECTVLMFAIGGNLPLGANVTAHFGPPKPKLSVTKSGTGSGTVTGGSVAEPNTINCGSGSGCEHEYEEGALVTLSKAAEPGSEFKEWTGACTGSGTCEVTMSEAKSVGAKFDLEQHLLSVSKSGTGTGTVTSFPAGIACGATCSASFAHNTVVTLSQLAEPGSEFKEWTGACSGSGTCEVTMSEAKSVGAKFDLEPVGVFKLTVSKSGTGTGTVTSSPAGINCGGDCEESYAENTLVTLSQLAEPGSEFKEWTGACSGSGTCEVTMSAAKSVGAKFDIGPHLLSVTKSGTGTGTVTSSPAGINCGATCSASFAHNTVVTLTKAAEPGSEFKEWTGACSGSGTCEVTMSEAKSVGAKFDLEPHLLTVSKSGTGTGTVTSSPAGINCGATCSASFAHNSVVTLSQSASAGSEFKEWTGACSGSGTCEVTMSAAKSVGAKFDLIPRTLTITKAGTGTGEVKCKVGAGPEEACAASYPNGSSVKVIATPSAGSELSGFSGACSGASCTLSMTANKSVTATFNLIPRTLTVSKAGSGSGTVTCDGGSCASSYPDGTKVTLAASAASGSTFAGWSGGGCSGTGTCVVTLNANTTVTATFNANPAPPTCATDPALCPPPPPPPPPNNPKPLKCKKGFKKKTVKGKAKCVKVKKHKKHRH
jgi:hypothetical protein